MQAAVSVALFMQPGAAANEHGHHSLLVSSWPKIVAVAPGGSPSWMWLH